MTTRTAAHSTKKETRMKERDRRNDSINTQLGFTTREERLQHDRYSNGTNGLRQRPRHSSAYPTDRKPMLPEAERLFIQLIEAVDKEAARESAYPKDVNEPARYAVGDKLMIRLIDKVWDVEVTVSTNAFGDRWRAKLVFVNEDASFSLTHAQIEHIQVKTVTFRDHQEIGKKYGVLTKPVQEQIAPAAPVALAPTHLLPAQCPPVPARFCYHAATWEGEQAKRVEERIRNHWHRQAPKLFAPFGVELPPVIAI